MRNRRIAVIALMLCAVLCIGVGYASLNDTITATGTVTYTPDFQIQWGDVSSLNAYSASVSADELTFTVDTSALAVNESITFDVPVVNNSKYAAKNVEIKELTVTAVDDCYDVTVTPSATTIAVDGSINVTITVKLTSAPLVDSVDSKNFTFKVYAEQSIS